MKSLFITLCCALCVSQVAHAQGTQPVVAIHDSELTRALESMPASGATPNGAGTTSNQWWTTQWHYFVMPDAVKEALRSDGTAFRVLGDSNILAGALTNVDGSPKYPILISLAAEAVDDGEIAQLTNYVASGGFLFVGSSSFTRHTNGTTRGDFAIANALGLHMVNPALTNWYFDTNFTRISNNRLVTNIPSGQLAWQMPQSSEETSWPVSIHLAGETPNAVAPGLPHLLWQVQPSDATVIAQGDGSIPYLVVKRYGKGYFIYHAAMQPLIGHGGWAPGMYAYSIFKSAIQWAFESASRPLVKLSPWPYPYDAAVIFRHDMEAIPSNIISIEGSAQFEHTNGASGDYYFCTGTLRLDMPDPTFSNTVASLQRAMTNYGASIYPHNGGLTNINPVYSPPLALIEPNLVQLIGEGWLTAFEPYTFPVLAPLNSNGTDYDYWHWAPDEILDLTSNLPAGFANGKAYAFASISNSFVDVAGWQLTNGNPRAWVSPYFNATREGSFQIEEQVGIKSTGDTKLTPFPSWNFSTQTPDKYYSFLQLPVSDWFVGSQVAQSVENGHTAATIQAMVDFYYNLGGLINLYCHSASDGSGMDGLLPGGYVTYSLSKPRIWSANAAGIYSWWQQRSNVLVTVGYANISGQSVTTLSIAGESNTNAAVEILAPSASYSALQVSTNGTLAGTNVYRTNGQTIKILVGTSVSNAVISYLIPPVAQDDVFIGQQGSPLVVSTPGVLTNDTAGTGGGTLTATLVSGPVNGSLTLNADGSFTYTPTGNYTGADGFTYQAVSGSLTSSVATVTIMIVPPGEFVYDTFARPTNTADIFPWIQESGAWSITNNALVGTSSLSSYGYAYYDNNASWTDFSVQAQIQFSSTNGWGGGIGGRLNPITGAHYALWVYPEGSPGGPQNGTTVLRLFKFQTWTAYTNLTGVPVLLPPIGTNAHIVKLTFQTNSIAAYFDGVLITNVIDNGSIDGQPAYTNGTISLNMWTQPPTTYTMTVDSVIVSALATVANNDSYSTTINTVLHVLAPGVLLNDSGGSGPLTAVLASGPSNGTLTLTNNGGFTYAPANNFSGADSFTYKTTDGQTTSSVATVTINISNPPIANNDSYNVGRNTTLIVGPPGILGNDTGGIATLSAVLVSSPSNGTLTFTNNGSFGYAPANNYTGSDSFTYQATDGVITSTVATVTFTVTAPPTVNNDIYGVTPGKVLNVPAPGVLTNDVSGGGSLTALLSSAPLHGIFNLTNTGGFSYLPTNNFIGIDDFTYQATDGVSTSGVATVAVEVTPVGQLLVDDFTRSLLWPWIPQAGTWGITNNALTGISDPSSYGNAYLSNNWTDYIVQGQIQFSTNNAWGGGIGGRLVDPVAGRYYGAWIYPENSPGGPGGTAIMKVIKFHSWNDGAFSLLQQVTLTNGVGTNWHATGLAFQGSNIFAYFDGNQVAKVTDDGSFDGQSAYTSGGISADKWTESTDAYILSVSNIVVAPLVANDSYSVNNNAILSVPAPGVLANDTDVYGDGLTTALVSGPAHGTLSLTNNGGFIYTPANNFGGTDSFVYRAFSGATNLGTATVAITVVPVLTVTASNFSRAYGAANPIFTVGYGGFVNGDGTNVLTGTPTITTTAVTNSPVSVYTITVSQGTLSAPNYNFAFVNGTLTVTQAVVTIASGIVANNKTYNATTTATISSNNVTFNGVLGVDSANVRLSTNGYAASFASANAGTGIGVTVSGFTLTGAAAGNYALTQPLGLTANITAASVTITSGISANGKVYNGTTSTTINSNSVALSGVLAGDTSNVRLSTNGYTANFVSANAGTGIGVTVSGLTLTGGAAGNYTLTQPVGLTANITAVGVTIASGISANGKAYNGTTSTTINSNNVVLSGVLAGDTNNVRLSTNGYTANFVSANTGTGIGVTVSGLTLAGGAAGNYTLTQPVGLTANISAVGVTIISGISANNKPYDGTTTATITSNNVVLAGVVAGDTNNVRLSTNGYTASFASANAGTGIGVTVSGLTLTGTAATNYTLTQPVGLTANISAVGVTIISGISANNKPYDGTTTATISSNTVVLAGLVDGDTNNVRLSTNGYTANFVSANAGTGIGVTVSGLTLTGTAATNYTLTQPVGLTANISAVSVTVTVTSGISANSKPYDGTTTATISSNNVVLAGVVAGDTNNVRLSTNGYTANFVSANSGTGIGVTVTGLTLTGSAAVNYTLTQPTGLTANITAKALTIVSGSVPLITSARSTNNVVTITWSAVAGGIYRVQYIDNLNGANWNDLAPDVAAIGSTASQTNNVIGVPHRFYRIRVLNLGITANSKVYDGTTTATVNSNNAVLLGVIGGDVVNLSTNGYIASFASAGVSNGIAVTVSGLSLTGASAANYTLVPLAVLAANITPAGVTIGSGITANNKVYDGTTAATIFSNNVVLTGLVDGDTNNVRLSTNGYTANFASANAGTSLGVTVNGLTLTGVAAANYTLSQPTGLTANITGKNVTITSGIGASSKPYDGTTTAIIASNNVALNGVLDGDTNNVRLLTNGYTANFVSANAGTEIGVTVNGLTLTGTAAANYTLSQPTGLTANITGKNVTITSGISVNDKPYDGTTTATIRSNSVALNGVLPGDAANVRLSTNGYTAAFASANTGTGIGVTVGGLTLTGGAAANYALSQPAGLTANVTGKSVTIISGISVNDKSYDGTTTATIRSNSVALNGVLPGDAANVRLSTNGYTATFASANVGTGIGVTVGGLTLTGGAAANYTLSQPTGLTANITGKSVTITSGISASGKVYDGTTTTTISSNNVVLNGVLAGDANNVRLSTNGYAASFASAGAASGVGVTISGLTLTGTAAANYTLTPPPGLTANISAKALTIASGALPVITSIRLTNGVITITWTSVAGGIYRAQYIDTLSATNWNDLLPDVTATGSTASQTNNVTGVPHRFYRIKLLNPGISANNKVYDGTTVATISSNNMVLVGIVGGDTVNLLTNGYTANFASANVGTGIAVTVNGLSLNGASATNYTLTPPAGLTANITPATLTVSAVSKSRTIGLPNSLTASYSGFVLSEGTNVLTGAPSLSTTATTNSPPATYPITVSIGTLSATNYVFAGFTPGILTVVAAPQLGGVALAGNKVVFSWPSIAGQTYYLQYRDNLTTETWTLLGLPVAGTGNPISATNSLSASPQRFFRLGVGL